MVQETTTITSTEFDGSVCTIVLIEETKNHWSRREVSVLHYNRTVDIISSLEKTVDNETNYDERSDLIYYITKIRIIGERTYKDGKTWLFNFEEDINSGGRGNKHNYNIENKTTSDLVRLLP